MPGDDDMQPLSGQQPDHDAPQWTAQQAHDVIANIGPRRRAFNEAFSRSVEWVLEGIRGHWLFIVNGALAAFVGLAVLAPIGYALGMTGPASAVFNAYHFACAQTPSHSFFIFGYQVCLCSRCLAIYSSILFAGAVLALVRNRHLIRGIPIYFWFLAMLPMALDGGTQLFGLRESNLALRLLTGSIFGIATAWFLFPQIEEAANKEEPAPAYALDFMPPDRA